MVLYLVTLCHLRTRMLCGKSGWNWTDCSREDFFKFHQGYYVPSSVEISLKFVDVFSLFCYYLPLEKDVVLYWNKPESPATKDVFCQVLLKLAQWPCIFTIPWIGRSPSFVQTLVPFTKERFVPSLVEIGPVILVKKKMRKVHRQTDDRRRMIRKAHLAILTSLWERHFLKRNLKQ